MTIGIGVLCSGGPAPQAPRPNTIVLIGGVATGTVPADYTWPLHKVFAYRDENLYGVSVGDLDKASDLLPAIQREFQHLTARNHLTFAEALNDATYDHRARHFKYDVLPNYRFPTGDFPEDQQQQILEVWQQYDVGVHIILGTFDDDGKAVLYVVARMLNGWVHRAAFPGIATIGYGANSANVWLNYRRQVCGGGVTQSAYHAYEAAHVALKEPGRRSHFEVVIATADDAFRLTSYIPEIEGCPVSLHALDKMFEQYGPRDTEQLVGAPKVDGEL